MENQKFWSQFLDAYRELPELWQRKTNEYNNRVLKASAYEVLVKKLKEICPDANREMVVRKINTFRTTFRKELKRVKKSEKSGAGTDDVYKSNLWYYDKLSFLVSQEDATKGSNSLEVRGKKSVKNKVKTIEKESLPQRKRNPAIDEEDIEMTYDTLLQPSKHKNYKMDALAESWAVQYDEIQGNQKFIARKIISDVLFHGCMGTLELSHAAVIQQHLLKASRRVCHPSSSPLPSPSPSPSPADTDSCISYENDDLANPPILFVSIPLSSESEH